MIGVEEGSTAHTLLGSCNQQFFSGFVVFEVGGRVVDGVFVNEDTDAGVFSQDIAGSEQKISGLDFYNGFSVFFDKNAGKNVAFGIPLDGASP